MVTSTSLSGQLKEFVWKDKERRNCVDSGLAKATLYSGREGSPAVQDNEARAGLTSNVL